MASSTKHPPFAERAHHPRWQYGEIAGFIAELRQRPGNAARALEFTILTATRSGEVLGAKWSENLFEKRRRLMDAWSEYSSKPMRPARS
jgi:integrase